MKMNRITKIVLLSCFCIFILAAAIVHASGDMRADDYMQRMLNSLQRGDFTQAVISGAEAEKAYGRDGKIKEQIGALVHLSTAYQSLGRYRKALRELNTALELSKKTGDLIRTAYLLGKLGNIYIFINQLDEAEAYLKEAFELSVRENDPAVRASVLNYLGNLYALRKLHDEAAGAYKKSASLSDKTNDRLLSARALTNLAKVLLQRGDVKEAAAVLGAAHERHTSLDNSHEKAYGLINIGRAYRQIGSASSEAASPQLSLAAMAFKEALSVAEEIGDHLSASYAFGYLGQADEENGDYSEALRHTRQAIFAAQQVHAPESLYLWQWQSGKILKALGKTDEALSAYRNAVYTLRTVRDELLADCRIYNQLSFRESVEPVYFGLADLLLKRADSLNDREVIQSYFREARRSIELMKTAELQDYFQDACVVADKLKAKSLDALSSNEAVVYIIPLSDRLELLLSLEKGIKKFTVKVDAETFTKEIRLFRRRLEKRTTRQYLPHAQRLYEWIIRPLESELASQKVDTLIFVPHGPMFTVPMAALHDGKGFLIERFALATTPGLSLTDPGHMQRERIKVLLAGLTEPVQGFPALINVPMELKTIRGMYPNKLLQDGDFRIPLMRKELESIPYSIVHIASHGEFYDNSRNTYILTWDEKLTMDDLEEFMGIRRFRKEPVALLTLSACVTAAGDDRAALGLAGVAVKAGARSAVATLWYINDHTSYELITEFYGQMRDVSLSNAKALQRAQIKLLNDRDFKHPGYWSPFLLIGNWL